MFQRAAVGGGESYQPRELNLTQQSPAQTGHVLSPGLSGHATKLVTSLLDVTLPPADREEEKKRRGPMKRREMIPEKPNVSLNVWSIMKSCIGKDLSKIAFPVSLL